MQTSTPNSTRRSVSSRRNEGERERHKNEVSAGGLVFRRTKDGLQFAMVIDSYGKWAFPKGHVRPGERYRQTAIREIREEMGLGNLRYVAKLDHIDIWFRDRFVHKGMLIHKYIYYFLFEAPPDATIRPPKPQEQGETIRGVAWVSASELLSRSSYRDMVGIIKKALRLCGLPLQKMSAPSAPRGRRWRFRKDTR
jgi:ADP-ribose pyrophosphatase YjhB (NUDIX family)